MSESMESIEKMIQDNQDKLIQLEEWIVAQKHFPRSIPRNTLILYLKFCDYDLEETKKQLQENVKFRIKNKYLFTNRDVESEELKRLFVIVEYARFSKITKEGYAVEAARIVSPNLSNLCIKDIFKYILMTQDMHSLIGPNINGVIHIYDTAGFTFQHFLKVVSSLQVAIHYSQYGQGYFYMKPKQVHFLHCSSIVRKLLSILKPFFSKELVESIHYHSSGFESLHKFIDKKCLPIEYGGSNGTFDEHMKNTLENMQNNRDFVKNDENFFLLSD